MRNISVQKIPFTVWLVGEFRPLDLVAGQGSHYPKSGPDWEPLLATVRLWIPRIAGLFDPSRDRRGGSKDATSVRHPVARLEPEKRPDLSEALPHLGLEPEFGPH